MKVEQGHPKRTARARQLRAGRKPIRRRSGIVGVKPRRPSIYDLDHPVRLKPRHRFSLSGAEKRRRRKGGKPGGGPGSGGVGGAMKRLAAEIRKAQR